MGFPQCGTENVVAKTYVEDVSRYVRLAVVAVGHPQSRQVGHSPSTGFLLQPSLHPPQRQLPIQDPFLGSCDGSQAILPFTRPHWRVTHCTGVKASAVASDISAASLPGGVGGFSNNHSSVPVRPGLLSNTEASVASSSDGCERASDRHSTDARPRRSASSVLPCS